MESLNHYNPTVVLIFFIVGAIVSFCSAFMPPSGQGRNPSTPNDPNDYEE